MWHRGKAAEDGLLKVQLALLHYGLYFDFRFVLVIKKNQKKRNFRGQAVSLQLCTAQSKARFSMNQTLFLLSCSDTTVSLSVFILIIIIIIAMIIVIVVRGGVPQERKIKSPLRADNPQL